MRKTASEGDFMSEDPLQKELFDILACPQCRGKLEYSDDKQRLRCRACGSRFPIEDGIPILDKPKR
jgi:uncharacterized protein YbaR (Trm112 family)